MDWVSIVVFSAIGLVIIFVMIIIAKANKKLEDEMLYQEILDKNYGEINNY